MKDAESPSPLVGKDEAAVEEASVLEQLAVTVSVIDRAVRAKETRTVFNRVLRQVAGVRRRMQSKDLRDFVTAHIPPGNPSLEPLLAALDEVGGGWVGCTHSTAVQGLLGGGGVP